MVGFGVLGVAGVPLSRPGGAQGLGGERLMANRIGTIAKEIWGLFVDDIGLAIAEA